MGLEIWLFQSANLCLKNWNVFPSHDMMLLYPYVIALFKSLRPSDAYMRR